LATYEFWRGHTQTTADGKVWKGLDPRFGGELVGKCIKKPTGLGLEQDESANPESQASSAKACTVSIPLSATFSGL
jgi:hypothetical protein